MHRPFIVDGIKLPIGYKAVSELPTTFEGIRNCIIDSHGKFKYISVDIID
jgi:hypothetical protein